MDKIIEQIGDLVGKDDLRGAIELLHSVLKNSPKLDEVILLSGKLSDAMRQIRLGMVDFQQSNITKNQIRFGIIDLLREIVTHSTNNPEISKDFGLIENSQGTQITQISTGTGDNIGRDKISYGIQE